MLHNRSHICAPQGGVVISLKALKASVGHGDPCPFWRLSLFSIVEFRIISLSLREKYGAFAGQALVVTGHLLTRE
jgi:hypothetical protein